MTADTAASGRPASEWWGRSLYFVRATAGIVAVVVSQSSATKKTVTHGLHRVMVVDHALRWAILLLGIFILVHLAIETLVIILPQRPGDPENVPNPFADTANVLVTTPAVVLGLLAVFGTSGTLTNAVKVGAASLATALLLAIVVSGLASMTGIQKPPRSTVIRLLFNVTLWALVLGVLGITTGLIYRP